jgi:hypothetical protein
MFVRERVEFLELRVMELRQLIFAEEGKRELEWCQIARRGDPPNSENNRKLIFIFDICTTA